MTGKKKRKPLKNVGKYNTGHSKRKNFTWNEVNKKVRNKEEWTQFVHE